MSPKSLEGTQRTLTFGKGENAAKGAILSPTNQAAEKPKGLSKKNSLGGQTKTKDMREARMFSPTTSSVAAPKLAKAQPNTQP
jgi:hypothetical protein